MNKSKFKYKYIYKPQSSSNLITVFTEDYFINPSSSNLLNFYYYNNDTNFESLDDNYENIKNFKYFYLKNYQNLTLNLNNYFLPKSYTTILDSFRADFDEND
jgi:hypothetical protein